MDHRDNQGGDRREDGMIYKSASLGAQEVTDAELSAINKYTLSPLAADEVFTFKAVLCDNETDRQYEQFTTNALNDMAKLFLGRTVIKDHVARADNQVARIYATDVSDTGKTKPNGEPYLQLIAHCYMVRTESNADLIKEIEGGIKKEGSVSFRAASCVCSICGTNNAKTYCPHWPGRSYETKDGGKQVCTFKLDAVKDAYEFSLVAVPAQRRAGTSKSYTGTTVYEDDDREPSEEMEAAEREKTLNIRARIASAENKKTI